MKNLFLLSLLSVSFLASAAPPADQDNLPVTISGIKERIVLPERYRKMHPDEFYDYMRAYDLSNGMTLSVFHRGFKMYAALDDQVRHEIVAITPNTFVALDKQLKMTINLHDNNDASGELYMMVPARRLSNNAVAHKKLVRIALR
ncbi:hypothetical protein LT85_4203 [Collimonas arenae]|uniref:Uncharacterized protein n=1 Tax=Collimonas arenae TaxID=279058 RepID=A0A0A1FFS2_9BURK|nr:hypothetical protein [Collimonas arenae]AIY43361.1 hypothetical protein LT85_4203 [Collimonas arenae]